MEKLGGRKVCSCRNFFRNIKRLIIGNLIVFHFKKVISPNIYRSFSEALESFKWFDYAGDWQAHFSSYQRNLIIYLGSTVMYLLGIRLKYKLNEIRLKS